MPNHKYTTNFSFEVQASDTINDIVLSKANIQNLSSLIPTQVDLEKNIDLMGVAFNAAVVNEFNKNGDGISTETAIESVQQFVHKPTNIEHDRDKIVGHIVSAGFSRYGQNSELMTEDEALIEDNAYNIALAAVVYRTASKEFADLVMNSTDSDSDYFGTVSASWEVGFNDYVISVGGDDLFESTIISDPDEIKAYSSYLKSLGGRGVLQDGRKVNRLIVGDIYPLGIGFTSNPAADVKGLIVQDNKPQEVKRDRPEPIDRIITKSKKQKKKQQHTIHLHFHHGKY